MANSTLFFNTSRTTLCPAADANFTLHEGEPDRTDKVEVDCLRFRNLTPDIRNPKPYCKRSSASAPETQNPTSCG